MERVFIVAAFINDSVELTIFCENRGEEDLTRCKLQRFMFRMLINVNAIRLILLTHFDPTASLQTLNNSH